MLSAFKQLISRLLGLFLGDKLDREMEEEMRFHIEMETERNIAAGMPEREARCAALRAFGGIEQLKERERDLRSFRWIEDLLRDFRFGFRMLVKSPVFSFVAIISLALAIGLNTAVFSLVNGILLKSLPVPSPNELSIVTWSGKTRNLGSSSGRMKRSPDGRVESNAFCWPVVRAMRKQVGDQAQLFGFYDLRDLTVQHQGQGLSATGMLVSRDFFEGLAVNPALGSLFSRANADSEISDKVVVSFDFWEREFGSRADVIGNSLILNGFNFQVIGVLPKGLNGLQVGSSTDFYIPFAATTFLEANGQKDSPRNWWMKLMLRIPYGTESGPVLDRLEAAFIQAAPPSVSEGGLIFSSGWGGLPRVREWFTRPLLLLSGIVALVILIACFNLAGILISRGAARTHEFAIRRAMGAGRLRLMGQSLAESILISLTGGALGLLLAFWGKTALANLLTGGRGGASLDVPVDWRVLLFTLGTAMAAGVLSGLIPAWRAACTDPLDGLKNRGLAGRSRQRTSKGLIIAQVALSVLLLIGGGLYGKSLVGILRIDPGFPSDNLLMFEINPTQVGYSVKDASAFMNELKRGLSTLPGVKHVGVTRIPLLMGWTSNGNFSIPGETDSGDDPHAYYHEVSDGYFETMQIPIKIGRAFTASDQANSEPVAVVNDALAKQYLKGQNPIGRQLKFRGNLCTIIGVCKNVKYADIKTRSPPTIYVPFQQANLGYGFMIMRTEVEPYSLSSSIQGVLNQLDSRIPMTQLRTQEEIMRGRISRDRLFAFLVGGLAGVALLLCSIGLYGLVSFNVTRRRSEIGIRMALGASRKQIAIALWTEIFVVVGLGVIIGLPSGLATAQFIEKELYQVPSFDSQVIFLGLVALGCVAIAATWVPVRRALQVDPSDVLKRD